MGMVKSSLDPSVGLTPSIILAYSVGLAQQAPHSTNTTNITIISIVGSSSVIFWFFPCKVSIINGIIIIISIKI